ncbi:MAG: hypothetical protein KatS3mg003_2157 [Candidatus Nitrosocaldaceae archaeon]|nr:MAG: hypothetical protein KatS3mg003_0846 [Candidatus Nitrosocaldaceae archaeon]GIU72678.1 MAG: hypothetical protein KatS3mg003_2157 [Candidatus Nitrosocaldaceae archaeon]
MPKQVFDKDEIVRLADKAQECRIVRRKDKVKIKIRRSRMLYTYVANANEADEILNKINIEKVEF